MIRVLMKVLGIKERENCDYNDNSIKNNIKYPSKIATSKTSKKETELEERQEECGL